MSDGGGPAPSRSRLGAREIRELLDQAGIAPSKALGQNFVVDPNTIDKIVRLADVQRGDNVVEIGPGLGSLTLALADAGATVTAVEIDRRLSRILREIVPPSVKIVEADALNCDWDAVLENDDRWQLVANLPYNIATPLVMTLLERVPKIERMLIMVQREVADRMVASSGDKAYGSVSVRIAYFASVRIVGSIGAGVFHPRPRVDSALVRIERRPAPPFAESVAGYSDVVRLIRAGFTVRRKMLRRSLAGLVSEENFASAGIASTRRAEDLDITDWGTLASCLSNASNAHQ